MFQNQEFIQEFVDEARTHADNVEAALLKKGRDAADKDTINDVFRAVHSIKGTAGFFGLKKIVTLAHAMENVFGEVRNGKLGLDDHKVDTLLSANDCLKDMIENVFDSEEKDIAQLAERLNRLLEEGETDLAKTEEKQEITVSGEDNQCFKLEGLNSELLNEGIRHGHHIYEVRLRINHDLLNYTDGPIKLFNRLQSVGMVIDTKTDYSEIESLDDILEAVAGGSKDVYLGILVTTVLEKDMFAQVIDIPVEKVRLLRPECFENTVVPESEARQDTPKEPEAEIPREIEQKTEESKNDKTDEKQKAVKLDDSIRVHVSILNDLMNMASEMVLGRNQLLRTLEGYRKTIPGLAPILQNIDRLTSGMQEKIMQTRMQPVGNVFNKFPRIIRDMSKNLSKEIDLVIEGEDVELDKSMIEALGDPLTHLVRNSADHGLENPEAREKAGKYRTGKIILKAYHEGGYVNIDVIDDGAGIDADKVKKKALEKGLISKDEMNSMNDQEALKLIFKPGFSTAEKVTDVSGRGVGMDVVRTNIEKLGGSIEIFTAKGSGTTIRLALPLTLAIIQSLIVEVEGHKFALPQVNLQEIVKIKYGDETRKIEFIKDSEVLRLRGRLLPIVHLADVLGIQRTFIDPNTGERKADRRSAFADRRQIKNQAEEEDELAQRRDYLANIVRVLVLKIGNKRFGLAVNTILGSEETLVKTLPVYMKDSGCYSGVTIMGDGKTAMILDPEGIIHMADLKFRDENEALEDAEAADNTTEMQNLLLFKCSGNESLALELSMVSRVEEIKASDIERVGDKEYIKFRGDSLRVIRPEDYLPINRQASDKQKLYVIIPKLVSHPIGILIQRVDDNVNTRIKLNTEDIKVSGLVGSAIFDNRIILILNIYELFEKVDPVHYGVTESKTDQKKSILVVEDTPFFQKMEISYLESAGYDVTLAVNGKAALEMMSKKSFDLVVSDIQMPVMDGLEMVKKIKESKLLQHIPVIAVTAMTGEYNKGIGLESGFDYYEYKLDRDKLLKTVKKAMAHKGVR